MKHGRRIVVVSLTALLLLLQASGPPCAMLAGDAHAPTAPATPLDSHAHGHAPADAPGPASPTEAPQECSMAAPCSAPALGTVVVVFNSGASLTRSQASPSPVRYVAPTLPATTPPPRV